MTTVDVIFRFTNTPREQSVLALSSLREVYGVRRVTLDERAKSISVEYDATRLTGPILQQLLRRAGFDLVEDLATEIVPDEPATAA